MKTLGNLIKNYRNEHDLSLRDFAALCEVSHSYIDKLEKGIDPRNGKPVEPTLDIIEKLAKAMGLSLESVLRAIGKIDDNTHNTIHENIEPMRSSPSKKNDKELYQVESLSPKDEKDIEKRMKKIREDLTNGPEGLMFSGEPMSQEALESILSGIEFCMKQAQLINKKYTPKIYRK